MGARGHPGPGPARVPSGLSLHLWEPAFPVCDVGRTILTPPGIKLGCCAAAAIDEDGDSHPGDRCSVGILMWGQARGHSPTAAPSRALRVRLLPCRLSRGASQNLTSGRTPVWWMRKLRFEAGTGPSREAAGLQGCGMSDSVQDKWKPTQGSCCSVPWPPAVGSEDLA